MRLFIPFRLLIVCVIFILLMACSKKAYLGNPKSYYPYVAYTADKHIDICQSMIYDTVVGIGQVVINNPCKRKEYLVLKGSMHNHTNSSDGYYTPIEAAMKISGEEKFDLYTITDHNVIAFIGKSKNHIAETSRVFFESVDVNHSSYTITGIERYVYFRVTNGDLTAISQYVVIL